MELRDIEYFSVVAKHGHLGRAAEALGLSQSALSKSLRRLEEEMRAKLVKRTPKGVEVTAEGSTLLARAHRLRLSLDDIAREVADVSHGLAGHVRIGSGPGVSMHLLPTACCALAQEAPNVPVSVRDVGQSDSLRAVRQGELDLAVVAMPAEMGPELTQEHLYVDEYIVCASTAHHLAAKKQVTLADVAQERWTVSEPSTEIYRHLHQAFEERGLAAPRVAVETANPATRLPIVAASHILGYSWLSVVRRSARELGLAELRIKELTSTFDVGVAYRRNGYLSPAARRFIEILKVAAKNIVKK
jgi:DNA-binding transcriptional LysR family regulator